MSSCSRRVERRLDARRTLRAGVGQHHLDEVRREEGPVNASEHQPFAARLVDLRGREESGGLHLCQYVTLPRRRRCLVAVRIERRRPLWQAGEERRLRGGQHPRLDTEVGLARTLEAGGLVAVGGEVQIERENLALRQAVFEPEGEDGFVHLRTPAAPALRRLPVEEQLRDLLRDRRSTLDDLPFGDVPLERARDGDGIDAGVTPEAAIFCGDGRGRGELRNRGRVEAQRADALAGHGFIQGRAVAIDDGRRVDGGCVEQPRRQRAARSHDPNATTAQMRALRAAFRLKAEATELLGSHEALARRVAGRRDADSCGFRL